MIDHLLEATYLNWQGFLSRFDQPGMKYLTNEAWGLFLLPIYDPYVVELPQWAESLEPLRDPFLLVRFEEMPPMLIETLDVAIYEALASFYAMLGDPSRLAMLDYMLRHDAAMCTVGHFEQMLTVSQPTISYHLRLLRDCRIVTNYKHSHNRYYYCLQPELIRGLLALRGKQR